MVLYSREFLYRDRRICSGFSFCLLFVARPFQGQFKSDIDHASVHRATEMDFRRVALIVRTRDLASSAYITLYTCIVTLVH
eukprot:SAG31_NODE_183_length_20987_cov_8.711078_15_plen_81_part_00